MRERTPPLCAAVARLGAQDFLDWLLGLRPAYPAMGLPPIKMTPCLQRPPASRECSAASGCGLPNLTKSSLAFPFTKRRYKVMACTEALRQLGVDWKDAERAARAAGGLLEAATQIHFDGAPRPCTVRACPAHEGMAHALLDPCCTFVCCVEPIEVDTVYPAIGLPARMSL